MNSLIPVPLARLYSLFARSGISARIFSLWAFVFFVTALSLLFVATFCRRFLSPVFIAGFIDRKFQRQIGSVRLKVLRELRLFPWYGCLSYSKSPSPASTGWGCRTTQSCGHSSPLPQGEPRCPGGWQRRNRLPRCSSACLQGPFDLDKVVFPVEGGQVVDTNHRKISVAFLFQEIINCLLLLRELSI